MNIADSNFIMGSGVGNSINATQKNISTDRGTAKVNTSANSDIAQVSEGQTFKGEVTSVTGDKVNILMDNNKTLVARMEESVNMNIGDRLTFAVKENNGASIVISPVVEGFAEAKDSAIFSILDANSFAPTEKNYAIAESLLANNMSVDKASMQKIMQQSYKFPDASLDTIIGLNKLNIPVNEANIKQYNDYMHNTHQLMNDIVNLSDIVSEFQGRMTEELFSLNKSAEDILFINKELLGIISDETDMPQGEGLNKGALNVLESAEGNIEAAENASLLFKEQGADGEMASQAEGLFSTKVLSAGKEAENVNNSLAANDGNVAVKSAEDNITAKSDDEAVNSLKPETVKTEKDLGISKQELSSFADNLKALGVDEKTVNDMVNNSDTSMKLLNAATGELSKLKDLSADKLNDFFNSKEYKQLLSNGVKEKFTLNPEKMKNPEELNGFYKSLYEKANKLMDSFSGNGGSAGEQLSEQAKSVAERVDFINSLNNMYAYAQLPVKLNSENNSELFVYMNKRSIKEKKDEISALLHLDMEHLGPTDVHVSLHGGIVHTRFYVEDEESARIIDEHMTMLEKAINESGFKHTNEVITREPTLADKPNEVVSNMLDPEMEKSVKRYTFDVRR